VRVVRDPGRRRTEEHVTERVGMVRDHDQVVSVRGSVVQDDVGGVSGDQVRPDADTVFLGAGSGDIEDATEELVLLTLGLVDLTAQGRVGRELPLDSEDRQPSV
jgi:hypothetical protein